MSSDQTLKKYMRLKKDVETAQQRKDRAQGALDQLMKNLDKDFKCASLKQAQKKLTNLQEQEEEAKEDFVEAMEEFEEKWEDKLQESEV